MKDLTLVSEFLREKTEKRLLDLTGSQIVSILVNFSSTKIKEFAISS